MPVATTHDWPTPAYIFDPLNRTYGRFNIDPCGQREHHYATHEIAKLGGACLDGSTEALDALRVPWSMPVEGEDRRVFMNPPFSRKGGTAAFVQKAVWELQASRVDLVCALLPARTDTKWWQRFVVRSVEWATWDAPVELLACHFLPGRIHFGNPPSKLAAPFPSAVVVWAKTGKFRQGLVRQPSEPILTIPEWRDVPRDFQAAG